MPAIGMAGFRSFDPLPPQSRAVEMAGYARRRYLRTVSRLVSNSPAIRRCDHPRSVNAVSD
jgi:hypothetical protein